jgi:bacterioferritin-associated ferredoxin
LNVSNQKSIQAGCNVSISFTFRNPSRGQEAPTDLTAEVQKFTQAGTGCSRCVREIDALVEHHLATRKKDPQLRIRFD